ncbi:MAG TPA: hypothetical protein VIR60_06195 [Gammaproteobacteria bacterium]
MNAKHLALTGLVAAALGTVADVSAVTAMSVGMDFEGYVTMLAPTGEALRNSNYADEPKFMGYRTPISGKMTLDITESGVIGGATFEPFMFVGGLASGRDVIFVPEDSLYGTPIPSNTLLVGNMSFDYGTLKGIPVSIVLDMGNLSTALMSAKIGDVITGVLRAASDNTIFTMEEDGSQRTLPLGPVVVATTTWNTTDVDTDGDGNPGPLANNVNPSGTVPLLVDTKVDMTNGDVGIGGSPIKVPSFRGFSPNFDITEITVTCVNALGSCGSSGIPLPPLPLSPQPLEPVQDAVGGILKKLGL